MESSPHIKNCMVCGSELKYLKIAEMLSCAYCGKSTEGHVTCPAGHYVCDTCHGRDVQKVIEETVFSISEQNPASIAEMLMNHPSLPMLGCEHAFIAAGSLLAALRNSPYPGITDREIREVFMRTAKQAAAGYCGLTGVCGIVPAVGAVFSVFLDSRCGSDREQKIVMQAVIRVSEAIAELTGPSCCKAYVRTSLAVAADVFAERFGVVLPRPKSPLVCGHHNKHPHGCREEKCPYYRKDASADPLLFPVQACSS